MSVFLTVRRKNIGLFICTEENKLVSDLKRVVGGIINENPEKLRLFYNDLILNDNMKLADCGLTHTSAMPHLPATLGLALMMPNNEFEELEISSFSIPPEASSQTRSNDIN